MCKHAEQLPNGFLNLGSWLRQFWNPYDRMILQFSAFQFYENKENYANYTVFSTSYSFFFSRSVLKLTGFPAFLLWSKLWSAHPQNPRQILEAGGNARLSENACYFWSFYSQKTLANFSRFKPLHNHSIFAAFLDYYITFLLTVILFCRIGEEHQMLLT